MTDEKLTEKGQKNSKQEHDSVPERITFWSSLVIVLALFGFLTVRAFSESKPGGDFSKPTISVRVDTDEAREMAPGQWSIPVIVRNTGNVPLEEVSVRVTSQEKGGKEQEVDLSFAYLAEGASEEAFIVTPAPPDQAKPAPVVTAYKVRRNARGY